MSGAAKAKAKSGMKRVEGEGGAVVGAYRDPLGRHPLLMAILEEVLRTMRERAGKFNAGKVKQEDLAGAGGAPDDSE